jgi:hypothetical protein
MLFTAFVLVAVNGEHDSLEKRVYLGHGHQPAKMCDMPRLRLQQKQKVAIFLRLVVVGKRPFLHVGRILKMARHFVLLHAAN